VPSRPYFHGDEDFYLLSGALIAYRAPRRIPSGMSFASAYVLTLDRRYSLGYWSPHGSWCWRTSKGDAVTPATLAALVVRCREVFGPNRRYAIDPPEEP
jgi:hypothetical protein